jgi:lysine 2,3-aminomutase
MVGESNANKPTTAPVEAAAPKKRKNKRDKSKRLSNIRKRIQESHFHRYIQHDIKGYEKYLNDGGVHLYSAKELEELKKAGVSNRLPPRATGYYLDLATRSQAITNLIKARPEEMEDLSGERDPSNQLKYSPVEGLLHKYELVLLYVVRTCSSWCRYCYRSDFLTSKTAKDIASVKEIGDYIRSYNEKIFKEAGTDDRDKLVTMNSEEKFPIREALLSGGDPLVLSNNNLFDYLDGLAEAGVRTIRIGTKELAFFPHRFDDNFFGMLDLFHELHPDVNLAFMVHFSHPDELLKKDDKGNYIKKPTGHFERNPVVEKAIMRLRSRYYVTLENQTPIIDSVNDNSEALRRLQVELKRLGVNNHYYFQCREIEGHKIFAVPVEKSYQIHRDSQKGLSGIEKSRFALSTEFGKLEVAGLIDAPQVEAFGEQLPAEAKGLFKALLGDGLIIFKAHRVPNTKYQGGIVVARRNPKALWITGYEDRILYDGRKAGDEKWSSLGKMLKTLLAPVVDIEKAEKELAKKLTN